MQKPKTQTYVENEPSGLGDRDKRQKCIALHSFVFHQIVGLLRRCLSPWQLSLRRVDVGAVGSEDVLFEAGNEKIVGPLMNRDQNNRRHCLIIVHCGQNISPTLSLQQVWKLFKHKH